MEVYKVLKILEEYPRYKPAKGTGQVTLDALSTGIAYDLIKLDGDAYILTSKGHFVIREFTSFEEYKRSLDEREKSILKEKSKDRKVTYAAAIISTLLGSALTGIITYFLSKC